MLNKAIAIAEEAGKTILEVYEQSEVQTDHKSDGSPVTIADKLAHEIIEKGLMALQKEIPVLSEESSNLENRKESARLWVVDPLDGTKDFLAKNDQFTVNIALVEDGLPVLGVIHIPAKSQTFWAEKNKGAFKNGKPVSNKRSSQQNYIAAVSNFHLNSATLEFLTLNDITQTKKIGSSIKFCSFAEGEIDVYPRLSPTMEWDTAAGQIISQEAGGEIWDTSTQNALTYNKESLRNPSFILTRKGLHWKLPST